jgi:hypothetical protein
MVLIANRKRKRIASTNLSHDISSFHWLVLCISFLLFTFFCPSTVGSSTVTEFRRHKFGRHHHNDGSPAAIWVYTGTLIDPVTGTDVCHVEGVELIQSIGHTHATGRSVLGDGSWMPLARFRRRCGNLRVIGTFEQKGMGVSNHTMENDVPSLECHTFLSRKCFCYCARDQKQVLQSLRRRRNGPKVQIPFHQAVSCYDSVISCIGVPASPNTATKQAAWLHTERPSGKEIWSPLVPSLPPRSLEREEGPLEFSIFARRRSPPWPIHGALYPKEPLPGGNNATDALHRPSRLRLIQWGSSQQQPSGNDFGVRETYQYTDSSSSAKNPHPAAVVRYTRHGEAPVWYGPGRMCQLELTGTRIDPMSNAVRHPIWRRMPWNHASDVGADFASNVETSKYVPVVSHVIRRYIPNFWKFGVSTKPSSVPEWKQSLFTETIQSDPKNDERDFLYYANALHTELERDVGDGPSRNSHREQQQVLSGDEYRQFYADLAVGRQMDQFLQQPLKWQPQEPPRIHPRLDQVFHKLSSAWDRIRAATSISIGPQHDGLQTN